jgi:hypothetical protein
MRKHLTLVIAIMFTAIGSTRANAQAVNGQHATTDTSSAVLAPGTPADLLPAHPDFKIMMNVDSPVVMQYVSRSQPLVIGGWTFECLSGLQPSTQRVGDIAVRFQNVNTGAEFLPVTVKLYNGVRSDVGLAFSGACPAVGSYTGFSLVVTGLPPANMYQMTVLVDTWDGAGRPLVEKQKITVIITD